MRRIAWIALLITGCSNGPLGGNADMAVGTQPDFSMAPPDMAPPVQGTRVYKGKGLALQGITSDDYVLYTDSNGNLNGVSTAGGDTPKTVGDRSLAYQTFNRSVYGKLFIGWINFDSFANVGDLITWSGATGTQTVATNTVATAIAASDDGSYVVFIGNASADGLTGDFMIAKSDGSGAKTLVANIQSDNSVGADCPSGARFAGNHFFIGYCDATVPDGGTIAKTGAIDMVDFAGNVTHLATNASGHEWFVSPKGDMIGFADDMGNLSVVTTNGGPATAVDGKFVEGFFMPDGSAVVYVTSDGAVKRAKPGSAPTVLVATGVTGFLPTDRGDPSISTDGKHAMVYNSFDAKIDARDITLIDTSTPGSTALVATPTGAVFGEPFTLDNSRAIYYSEIYTVTTTGGTGLVGSVNTIPVGGGSPTEHAKNVWLSFATANPTGVVYNDNYKKGGSAGRGDIKVLVDSTKADAPQLIVAAAEGDFFLTHDKKKAVFALMTVLTQEGIWVADLP